MKIITWNCNMAFRKKADIILTHQPDILIVPECEHPDKIVFKADMLKPTDTFWYGKSKNKGLGVFAFGDLKIKLLDHNPDFKFIVPLNIFNDETSWTVFAIWAQKPEYHDCYTEQIWNAVHFYNDILNSDNVILVGDFNSNSIWDKPKRFYNHTNLLELLETKNIWSTYHHFHNQTQGKERHSTLFMHRKAERPYHIDYCFASKNLIDKVKNVEVGTYEAWTKYSDHVPLIVEF
ncbi:endonuclease/exonuclease/phosphatase family protein [Flavihumibacter stibioxidans]|uniref:Exonuclease n=1 Tax=Flavihumibacter stibioxidans TaxID=1834163 RepID=A0ABR7M6K2_9BACT|nr:endonuclease/exonuclease/phosphatase family protein [Flavihumibacter stibioxidans]MBC6490666.1 exonuclease [Flavihumibacter stibioxidans]